MYTVANTRRSRGFLPKDYIRRKRAMRWITNTSAILVLSGVSAYVITRQSGGPGFTARSADAKAMTAAAATLPAAVAVPNASAPAAPTPTLNFADANGYELEPGPNTVTEASDVVLFDAKRNKELHVRVFYPNEGSNYPVIVFSHGAGGSQNCCDGLTRHWASYGYVTIQPTHDDSTVRRRNKGGENIQFLQAVRDALKKPTLWESRPKDISAVLDDLPALEGRLPALAGKMDMARIGVGGHSMGSYTAEAIAGALVDLPSRPGKNFADPRVKAVLCLSPQGPGQFGLNDHSFDGVAVPYMGVTGTLDSLGPVASPEWHKIPFERSQAGNKFHLFIEGANHMSFITPKTVLPGRAEKGEAIFDYTNSGALAFWDAYLKKDERARGYLASDALEKTSQGAVKISRR